MPRNTKQKQMIYEALCALDHPTATEVYECVRAAHPTVSRGTVFRVLGGFAECGKVRKLCLTDSDARFDFTLAPHAHARCRSCGSVHDVFFKDDKALFAVAQAEDFAIDGCEVEFFGLCAKCKKNASHAVQI